MHTELDVPSHDRGTLARMVTRLFDHWGLDSQDQLAMLGLAAGNRAAINRYRRGMPLANQRDMIERAGHLLAIHKNLRLLFPHNQELAYRWMTARNRAFDNKAPAEVIRERGFSGLLMVRAYLDRARGV